MGLFSSDTGADEMMEWLTKGRDAYVGEMRGLADTGYSAYNKMAALLGVGGEEDQDEAITAFMNTPGLQYAQDTMVDATQRQFAATGMSQSGNVLTALQDRASDLASLQFGTYLNQLGAVAEPGLVAKQGIADMQWQYSQGMGQAAAAQAAADASMKNKMTMAGINLAVGSVTGGMGGGGWSGALSSGLGSLGGGGGGSASTGSLNQSGGVAVGQNTSLWG